MSHPLPSCPLCEMNEVAVHSGNYDHEIDCKMDGIAIALKAMYVKKVQ